VLINLRELYRNPGFYIKDRTEYELFIFFPGRFVVTEELVDPYKGQFCLHESVKFPPKEAQYRDEDFLLVWRFKIKSE